MLEIENQAISVIAGDTTIDGYLNPSVDDNRIYAWYPPTDIEYNETNKSAIVYFNNMPKRSFNWSYPSQMPDIFFYFRVLSLSQLEVRQISERLIDLFDNTSIQTTNWSVKWISVHGYADGESEGSPTKLILVKNVSFNFTNVFRRG